MADENAVVPDAPESSSEESSSVFNDPFDYSDEAENFDDGIDFQMNDEGELELSLPPVSEDETTEETASEEQEEGYNPFEGVEQNQRQASAFEQLQEANRKLQERLDSLEQERQKEKQTQTLTQSQQEYRNKLEQAGFSDEQIDILLELRAKDEQPKEKTKEEQEAELQKQSELEIQKEASAVLQRYNGREGMPSVEQMRPWTDYMLSRFNQEATKVPLPVLFRIAENAPFIHWMDTIPQFQDKMRNITLREALIASENLRKMYYKKNYNKDSGDHYDHLYPKTEETPQETNTPNNNGKQTMDEVTAKRLAAAKKEQSLGVPGGEVETEDDERDRRRPKTAYEIAKESVDAAFSN